MDEGREAEKEKEWEARRRLSGRPGLPMFQELAGRSRVTKSWEDSLPERTISPWPHIILKSDLKTPYCLYWKRGVHILPLSATWKSSYYISPCSCLSHINTELWPDSQLFVDSVIITLNTVKIFWWNIQQCPDAPVPCSLLTWQNKHHGNTSIFFYYYYYTVEAQKCILSRRLS